MARLIYVVPALIFAVGSGSSSLWATPGTQGAAFLNIPVGAGPASMGSAYSALATDAYAPVWNPAGLGKLNGVQVEGQHLSYLESIHYEHSSIVIPLQNNKGLGIAIQYLGTGDIAGTAPAPGTSIGNFSAHYAAYSLAYGQQIADRLSLGITGKILEAKISDTSAKTYAADIGTLYRASDKLDVAATCTNLGRTLTFADAGDPLPLAFRLGGAYRPARYWTLALEGDYRPAGKSGIHLGAAWRPLEAISLRAGYKTETTRELSALAGMTVGVGIHLFGQELAYAWLPYGDLGDTQYFSLVIRFGGKDEGRENLQGSSQEKNP